MLIVKNHNFTFTWYFKHYENLFINRIIVTVTFLLKIVKRDAYRVIRLAQRNVKSKEFVAKAA